MTIEQIKERQVKAEAKAVKIANIIAKKYVAPFTSEEVNFIKSTLDMSYIDVRDLFKARFGKDFGYDAQDLRAKCRELRATQELVKKYAKHVADKEEFVNSDKVAEIWDFLQNWKRKAREYYMVQAKKYLEEKKTNYNARKYYYNFVVLICECNHINEEKLDDVLDKEVEARYKDFMTRIQKVGGTFKKVIRLEFNFGYLNGIVECENGRVKISSIDAGGYNIQCYHYRVLIKKINKKPCRWDR